MCGEASLLHIFQFIFAGCVCVRVKVAQIEGAIREESQQNVWINILNYKQQMAINISLFMSMSMENQ